MRSVVFELKAAKEFLSHAGNPDSEKSELKPLLKKTVAGKSSPPPQSSSDGCCLLQ